MTGMRVFTAFALAVCVTGANTAVCAQSPEYVTYNESAEIYEYNEVYEEYAEDNEGYEDNGYYPDEYAVNGPVRVSFPSELPFTMDAYEISGRGQIFSDSFKISNNSPFEVFVKIRAVRYENNGGEGKSAEIFFIHEDSALDIKVTDEWQYDIMEYRIGADGEISFQIAGTLSDAYLGWHDGDIVVSVQYDVSYLSGEYLDETYNGFPQGLPEPPYIAEEPVDTEKPSEIEGTLGTEESSETEEPPETEEPSEIEGTLETEEPSETEEPPGTEEPSEIEGTLGTEEPSE